MNESLIEEITLPSNFQEDLRQRFPYLDGVNYRLLTSVEEVREYLKGLKIGQPLVLDLETTGLNHEKHHIVGVALTYVEQEGVYIPIAHTVRPELNLPWDSVRVLIEDVLKGKQRPIIPYNQKFEGNFLLAAGMDTSEFDWQDCMVSVYVDDPNEGGRKIKLKRQTEVKFGIQQLDFGDMFPDVPKDEWNFADVDPEAAYLYACGDVDFTLRIWNLTEPAREESAFIYHKMENPLTEVIRRMENNGVQLNKLYYEKVRQELSARIEIVADRIYKLTGRKAFKRRTRTLVKRDPVTNQPLKGPDGKSIKEKKVDLIEVDFELSSPTQVAQKLFGPEEEGGLGIDNPHRTETGKVATSEAVVESMAGEHEVISDVLLYRKLVKCRSTYLDHLIQDCGEDGIGKFSFMQCAAPTGRLSASSGGPGSGMVGMNVHSTPKAIPEEVKGWKISKWDEEVEKKDYPCFNAFPSAYLDPDPTWVCQKKECLCIKAGKAEGTWEEKIKYWEIPNIRKGFKGREGYLIVAIDYSGVELRIATNLSKEPVWIRAFQQPDPDLHRETAKAVYNKEEVTKQERGNAKTINFATLFGGSGAAIAKQIEGMSKDEGQRLVDQFFRALPTLDSWIKGMHTQGHQEMCVYTWFRRKRPLHMYKDNDPKTRHKSISFGDRSTVSTAVQGTAADVMKIALLRLDASILKRGWDDRVKMLLNIHDECVFEVREDCIEEVVPILVENMAFPVKGWSIPLICDVEIGATWGDGQEHRLVDGKLILHSEISKAVKEGKDVQVDHLPQWADAPAPSPEEMNVKVRSSSHSEEEVTLRFRSSRTRSNMALLYGIIQKCKGPTPIVVTFAGDPMRIGVGEKVDVVSLLKAAKEKGLQMMAGV